VRPTRPITSVLDQLCVAEEACPGSGRTEDADAKEVKRSSSLFVAWDARLQKILESGQC
jgi:hypothetical protein